MAARPRRAKAPYRVFVSHATLDKWIAKVICDKLDALGVKSFRDDRDIQGGDDIPNRIREEIRLADEVLILLTPQSATRDWVRWEAAAAWACQKRIVVVQYHVEVSVVPEMLRSKKAVLLNDLDHYLAEVASRLEG